MQVCTIISDDHHGISIEQREDGKCTLQVGYNGTTKFEFFLVSAWSIKKTEEGILFFFGQENKGVSMIEYLEKTRDSQKGVNLERLKAAVSIVCEGIL